MKQTTLPVNEMANIICVRNWFWFSLKLILHYKPKRCPELQTRTFWQSRIKPIESMQNPEQISADLELPFWGHRCLLDHCGTKREMNVKSSMMPLAPTCGFRVTSVLAFMKIHSIVCELKHFHLCLLLLFVESMRHRVLSDRVSLLMCLANNYQLRCLRMLERWWGR